MGGEVGIGVHGRRRRHISGRRKFIVIARRVFLRFGGGCHGCGMADVTLKQGIEKTLIAKVPGVIAVRDATVGPLSGT